MVTEALSRETLPQRKTAKTGSGETLSEGTRRPSRPDG
jgi:hypothetical protein